MSRPVGAEAAIVTGASSGIGAAMAAQLADRGVRVGLTARRTDLLDALAASIRARGGTAAVSAADAADPDATRRAIALLDRQIGPVDLLIANAGIGRSTPAVGFSAGVVDELFRVNLIGASAAIEAVLPGMIERRRGRIVGIGSLASIRGLPGSAGYCASKAALATLLEGLRVDLRRLGISVSIVQPGFVQTPMTDRATHPRPWLMDADRAARIILDGIARGRRRIDFPGPMAALLRLVRALPDPVFDRLAARILSG
ncbi:SDR family NAD(P)-dependent oxidoreductase [Tautonia sociabilis]|uniref:SDR family NAD(P)-dependent oxidoreductase n=1 Tax=Tautonia sociabilis TaxID=2080755 RepID=A0A432MEZ8_9BACT|nr:SDR family NAD(P)-dependent oxidoreductase [Tautonia sociabilis]RUL84324.1 SDR family NAD(P)-dependent oxidoreductase [Tautonia sociabilis]